MYEFFKNIKLNLNNELIIKLSLSLNKYCISLNFI